MDFNAILEKETLELRAAQLQTESAAAIDVMVADRARMRASLEALFADADVLLPPALVDEARRVQAQNDARFDSLARELTLSNELLVDTISDGIKCSEEASRAQAEDERARRATYIRERDEEAQEAAKYSHKYEMVKRAVHQAEADDAAKAHLLADRDMEIAALQARLALVQQQQPAQQSQANAKTVLN